MNTMDKNFSSFFRLFQMLKARQFGKCLYKCRVFSQLGMNHPYSTESFAKIAGVRREAFQKQLNYKWIQLEPNLVRVHIPTLPYEAFDCYGQKMLPWKMLSLAESVDHNPGWNPADETDPEGFAMVVTVFARIEFSQMFYNIDSPKYPVYLDLTHEYLRRTSKCCKMALRHADVGEPYVVLYSIDVKLDSETRKPKPYPESWREFGIPAEPSKPIKHNFPERPETDVFYTEHKIHYSDTDTNRHANYTFYVRACYDSFFENITKKKFSDSATQLMDAGIKTLEVTYKQEAFMGDVITVASWVDPEKSNVYYFELMNKNETYTTVTFEFYRTKQDLSQQKGRL